MIMFLSLLIATKKNLKVLSYYTRRGAYSRYSCITQTNHYFQAMIGQLTSLQDQNKTFMIEVSYRKQCRTFAWPVDLGTVTLDTVRLPFHKVFQFPQDTKPGDLI